MSIPAQTPQPSRPFRQNPFALRWLAEIFRLRGGAFAAEVPVPSRDAPGSRADPERWVLAHVHEQAERDGTSDVLRAWRSRTRLVTWILMVVAGLSGFGAALAVLGDGGRPVNVVWTLGGLLGVHLFSLLLWAGGLGLGGEASGGAFGRAWLWLSRKVAPGDSDAVLVPRALLGLLAPAGLVRWWLGAVTHGLWLVALCGASLGLFVAFSVRSYGFVWETTILPAEAFVAFVEGLGRMPAWLGFSIPDAETIRASGARIIDDEAGRLAWSSWLFGCMVVYGIMPRALLWAGCLVRLRAGCRSVRLDLSLSPYAGLIRRLAPESERIGITDAAPDALPASRVHAPHSVSGGAAILVGLELQGVDDWPPALVEPVMDLGVLDSREQRRATLARLEADPPARLLVACDAGLSPDRGSLGLIAELSRHAGECRIWLVAPAVARDPERIGHWRDALERAGLRPQAVFTEREAALAWIEHGAGDA